MNNQLYTELKTQLETVVDGSGQPSLLFIKRWNNELQNLRGLENNEYPFDFPAAFLEFESPNETNMIGNNVMIYDPLDITVHIIYSQLDAGDGNMDDNFDIFTLKDKIISCLQLFRPTNTSNLFTINQSQDYDHDNLYEYKITFRCTFTDYTNQLPLGGSLAPLPPSGNLPYGLDDTVNFT